jgi:hypothetical protein
VARDQMLAVGRELVAVGQQSIAFAGESKRLGTEQRYFYLPNCDRSTRGYLRIQGHTTALCCTQASELVCYGRQMCGPLRHDDRCEDIVIFGSCYSRWQFSQIINLWNVATLVVSGKIQATLVVFTVMLQGGWCFWSPSQGCAKKWEPFFLLDNTIGQQIETAPDGLV